MDRDRRRLAWIRRNRNRKGRHGLYLILQKLLKNYLTVRRNPKIPCMSPTASTTSTEAKSVPKDVKKEPRFESNVLERTFSSPI